MSARRTQVLVVALAALAFATASPLARMAGALPPIAVASGRTAIAATLLVVFRPRGVFAAWRSLGKRSALGLLLAGTLLGAHLAFFLGGLASTSFAAAVALLSLEPLAVVLVAWGAFGIALKRAEWLGVLLATAGAFVVSRGAGVGEHRLAGDLMVVTSVVLYGFYVAAARGLRESMPALPYAATVYGVSALVLVPIVIPAVHGIAPPPIGTWVALGLLGVIPTLVGHTLVQVAARTAPPTIVALTSPGETVGSLAIGAALLRKWPTPIEGIGTAIILAGAVVAIRGAAASSTSSTSRTEG